MRLAVVSPFVDRWHGTERALAELLERLAGDYGCEIHLYAQRVEDLHISDPKLARSAGSSNRAPSSGTRFLGPGAARRAIPRFDVLNGFLRWWHTTLGGASYDVVFSPGIKCLHPDVVIVHALFHRLKELVWEENEDSGAQTNFIRRVHRRVYYLLLTALEHRIYTDPGVTLAAVSGRTAGLLKEYFQRQDVSVIRMVWTRVIFLWRRGSHVAREPGNGEFFAIGFRSASDWKRLAQQRPANHFGSDGGSFSFPLRLLVVGNDSAESFRARAVQLGLQDRCRWEISVPMSSIFTRRRTFMSVRAGKILSGFPWRRRWHVACRRLHRSVPVSLKLFTTVLMVLFFAIRGTQEL